MDDIVKRIRQQSYFGLEPYEAADEIEQLRQRAAELEKERDAALAEVALLKPNPLCDTGCMLSCKMEADYYEKQITALKSALRDAMKEMLRCQYYEGQLDKAVVVIAAALGEDK